MSKTSIKLNSPAAWLLATRPKTLTGAATPVMIGAAWAYHHVGQQLAPVPVVLCLLFAMAMQVTANYVNDYFDFVKGTDTPDRLGPRRACAQGWVTPRAMRAAIGLSTLLSALAGAPLVLYGGVEMVLIGMVCIVFCFLYTTHLSYMGWGDVLVLVFFGLVPVALTYALGCGISLQQLPVDVWLAALACGMVIDTLLIVNNYRDVENDTRAGKRTIIVRLGAEKGRKLYLMAGVGAWFIGMYQAVTEVPMLSLTLLPYLLLHVFTYRKMVRINKGKALNGVLADTARNMFLYGLLTAAGVATSFFSLTS